MNADKALTLEQALRNAVLAYDVERLKTYPTLPLYAPALVDPQWVDDARAALLAVDVQELLEGNWTVLELDDKGVAVETVWVAARNDSEALQDYARHCALHDRKPAAKIRLIEP